jgi:CRP-like cAMP-binding protein
VGHDDAVVSRPAGPPWIGAASGRDAGVLRPSELHRLRQLGTTRFAEAGTVVAASGATVTQVHVVADGEIGLMTRLDGGRATTAVVRAGGVVGDIPLLLGQPMPFDAVASRDTECVTLTRERWTGLLQDAPDLALRWMTSIARRLDDDRRRLVVLTSRPLLAQVAYVLLDMAEDGPGGRPVVRLSHATIAQLLGVRRQSVTRVVADLKRRGLVDVRYGRTELVDVDGVREVMGAEPLP